MIEAIVALTLAFGGGWWVGHESPSISCREEVLIKTSCIDVPPPADASFGATTFTLRKLHDQYKECRQAINKLKRKC